ncbi:hypothetical protein ACFO0N_18540 [Halobium salinum]|uniref:Uncharacterized protein n=1 Tax=Halobium salinum TaxID=1364940 RepID=A0ABD5PH30_9EURY|nr:hypothetical protein [Halobium salinum]
MARPQFSTGLSVRVVGAALVFVGALLPWLRVTADPAGTAGLADHAGLQTGLHFRAVVVLPLVVTALVYVVHRPSESWSRMLGSAAGLGALVLVGFYWLDNVGSTFDPGPGMAVTVLGAALLVLATTSPELFSEAKERLSGSG